MQYAAVLRAALWCHRFLKEKITALLFMSFVRYLPVMLKMIILIQKRARVNL